MSPTHVGMDRWNTAKACWIPREPHARGDGPGSRLVVDHCHRVSPTHVGMDHGTIDLRTGTLREPHARGDGPEARMRIVNLTP